MKTMYRQFVLPLLVAGIGLSAPAFASSIDLFSPHYPAWELPKVEPESNTSLPAVVELPELSPFIVPEIVDDTTRVSAPNDELWHLCAELHKKLTSVSDAECRQRNLRHSGTYSHRNFAIAYRDVAPAKGPMAGRVLLVGGIHGDEYSSVTAVFKWLERLEEQEGGAFYWRVVPVLNPDGLLMPPDESQRMNARGVDLNRNFPTPNWEEETEDYWVRRTGRNKRRYPGPAPLSEPESAWLAAQVESFAPDAVISVHAPHGIVDFDGPRMPPENLGPLELRLLGTYPGSMGRYLGVFKGIPMLTVELESAVKLPESTDMDRIWVDMVDWLAAHVANTSALKAGSAPHSPAEPRVSVGPTTGRDGQTE